MHEGRGVGRLVERHPGVLLRSWDRVYGSVEYTWGVEVDACAVRTRGTLLISRAIILLHLVARRAGAGSALAG